MSVFTHFERRAHSTKAIPLIVFLCLLPGLESQTTSITGFAPNTPVDPGVRGGPAGAGEELRGLTRKEALFFDAGKDAFAEVNSVSGTIPDTEPGLGPRFNLTSCGGCHAFPAVGGTSPRVNPQVTLAPPSQVALLTSLGIISANGPVREARFIFEDPTTRRTRDGGVHALFTITGRPDQPPGCNISQPEFARHMANRNVSFRIPTPTFGLGLIEAIEESTILALERAPKPFGIRGHTNRNDNDGTITRFGWKAQNKSLVIFSGEAYNVEQGVTNDLFPNERGEGGVPDPAACRVNPTPEDATNFDEVAPQAVPGDAIAFANFMRFLAPPERVDSYTSSTAGNVSTFSIANGFAKFATTGCVVCHVAALPTAKNSTAALSNKTAALFSDLLVHSMGPGLADGITQGRADDDEFRTAPLWGLGKRIFLLHDGRTRDLLQAIRAHGGEASMVINNFNNLSSREQQDILNFLRSL